MLVSSKCGSRIIRREHEWHHVSIGHWHARKRIDVVVRGLSETQSAELGRYLRRRGGKEVRASCQKTITKFDDSESVSA